MQKKSNSSVEKLMLKKEIMAALNLTILNNVKGGAAKPKVSVIVCPTGPIMMCPR